MLSDKDYTLWNFHTNKQDIETDFFFMKTSFVEEYL